MPKRNIFWTPQELLRWVVGWKKENIVNADRDQVWCIFDIDDFYKANPNDFMEAIRYALKNNIKLAYINECFECWILLHFRGAETFAKRGKKIQKKIETEFRNHGLGRFDKNKEVFNVLLPFQNIAIANAKKIHRSYDEIDWCDGKGNFCNPSTSIHLLVEEINSLIKRK